MIELNKIYNEDCLEFMKRVPDNFFDLVLTDPPYGIDLANMNMGAGKSPKCSRIENRKWETKDWDKKTPEQEIFDEIFRISKNQIIWGGNYFDLPPTRGFIVWDKLQYMHTMSHCEYAWTSFDRPSKMYRKQSAIPDKKHPTQKTTEIIEFSFEYARIEKHFKIFDPFMGSGTTAVACKSLGLDWCGCELEEDYCNIARKRLEKVQCSLF